MSTVTSDLGIPEQAQHIKSVEEMEAYRWGFVVAVCFIE